MTPRYLETFKYCIIKNQTSTPPLSLCPPSLSTLTSQTPWVIYQVSYIKDQITSNGYQVPDIKYQISNISCQAGPGQLTFSRYGSKEPAQLPRNHSLQTTLSPRKLIKEAFKKLSSNPPPKE